MVTTHNTLDTDIASQIGFFSDGLTLNGDYRWLYTAGTPGLSPDGKLRDTIVGQGGIGVEEYH